VGRHFSEDFKQQLIGLDFQFHEAGIFRHHKPFGGNNCSAIDLFFHHMRRCPEVFGAFVDGKTSGMAAGIGGRAGMKIIRRHGQSFENGLGHDHRCGKGDQPAPTPGGRVKAGGFQLFAGLV